MDMHSRNQYLKALIEKRGYHLLSKKEKIKILNEYCATTGQNRNYVIRKIRSSTYLKEGFGTRTRKVKYDGYVKRTLVEIWRIFDHPCGQRLKPLIQTELERLRKLKEIRCSEMVASKLRQIGTATIDRKLSHQKEVERKEKFIVGVNEFVEENEKVDIPLLTVSPEVERVQHEQLEALKQSRNPKVVEKALEEIQLAAKENRNLMPVLLDAAEKYVSLGEMVEELRRVFGTYQETAVF